MDLTGLDVDLLDFTQDHPQGRVVAQDVADGRRDLPLREDAGGDLVEQGLEQVVVCPVDQGDPDRRPLEGAGREEAAEATPDDDHVVSSVVGVGPAHSSRSTTVWT